MEQPQPQPQPQEPPRYRVQERGSLAAPRTPPARRYGRGGEKQGEAESRGRPRGGQERRGLGDAAGGGRAGQRGAGVALLRPRPRARGAESLPRPSWATGARPCPGSDGETRGEPGNILNE